MEEPGRLQSMGSLESDTTERLHFSLSGAYYVLEMVNFHSIPKKGSAKEWSNYWTIALISHASKVMLKFIQARLQQYMNWEIPDVQAGFRKSRGTRDQFSNIHWIIEKAREFQKNIYCCFTDYVKASDSVDHNKMWTILKEMVIPDLPPEKSVRRSRSNS